VADAAQVEYSADRIEHELDGVISIWVNNASTTVFAPVLGMTAKEYRQVTAVTYLGVVYRNDRGSQADASAQSRPHHSNGVRAGQRERCASQYLLRTPVVGSIRRSAAESDHCARPKGLKAKPLA
jgi:hypothetical protein